MRQQKATKKQESSTDMLYGRIVKALSGFYYVEAEGTIYKTRARGRFRNNRQKPLVGDFCQFDLRGHKEGYIKQLEPRRNALERPPIANVDQTLLVFSITEPDFDDVLLDKFLAVVEHDDIKPVIIITKIDIDQTLIEDIKKRYAPYELYFIDSISHKGVELIKELIKDKVTVVMGQSGVGKSTMLNALDDKQNIATGEISQALGRGRHTTRHVELIHMYGGYIADTPGFSSLEMRLTPDELATSYHDFRVLSSDCRFRGCRHDQEPDCAVKEAVAEGTIAQSRYEHYITMLNEARIREEKKYG